MQIVKRIPYIGSLVLLGYMPLHIFLSQWLSTVTGGLEVWKIAKDVVLLVLVLFTICLVFWQGKADKTFKLLLGFAVLYGALHVGLWLAHPDLYFRSAAIGTVYNMRLPLFVLLGYGAIRLLPKFVFSSVLKFVLVVSTLVASLGILQYLLPPDIMTHFGYSLERGARPFFLIDTNAGLIRIMSTLREPNALGAYLILPSAALLTLWFRAQNDQKRLMLTGALGLHLLAVFLTFSRSTWLGLGVSLVLVAWWQHKGWLTRTARRFWPLAAGAALLIITVGFTARNTSVVQQYVLHNNPTEQVKDIDSNQYHSLLVQQGLVGAAREPLGHGPGTAGLAAIQNPAGGQLTENYYVQIAYEIGIVGSLFFILYNIWLYVHIQRRGGYARTILLASFWGYVITNMLLHTWSNEAVAAQWWLLAGMALALPALSPAAGKTPPKRA